MIQFSLKIHISLTCGVTILTNSQTPSWIANEISYGIAAFEIV